MKKIENNPEKTIALIARWLAYEARGFKLKQIPKILKTEKDVDGNYIFHFSNEKLPKVKSPLGVIYYKRRTSEPKILIKARYIDENSVLFRAYHGEGKGTPFLNRVYRGYELLPILK